MNFGNDGFISLMVLIIMAIVLIMASYLGYTTKLEHLILVSTINELQSYYLTEGKILMSIYGDYYDTSLHPIILNAFRNNSFKGIKNFAIDKSDLNESDNLRNVSVSFEDVNNKKSIVLKTEAEYRGRKTNMVATGTLVNDLFEANNSILNFETIGESNEEDFNRLLYEIFEDLNIAFIGNPLNTYLREINNYEEIRLNQNDDKTYSIISRRETMEEPYVENFDRNEFILIIRDEEDVNPTLILGDKEQEDATLDLNGLIFIDGNIIISKNVNFNGIMIVKDGRIVVDSEKGLKVNGIIICNNQMKRENKEGKIDVSYNKKYIYKYGTYLPGFINLEMNVLKLNKKG